MIHKGNLTITLENSAQYATLSGARGDLGDCDVTPGDRAPRIYIDELPPPGQPGRESEERP